MKIDTTVLYEQALESLRHASDIRAKIIGAWLAIYSASAAAIAWVHFHAKPYLWVILLAAALMTLIMWLADNRNGQAIHWAKEIGKHIENDRDSGIPEERRFFSKLDGGTSHTMLINIFAGLLLVLLVASTVALS